MKVEEIDEEDAKIISSESDKIFDKQTYELIKSMSNTIYRLNNELEELKSKTHNCTIKEQESCRVEKLGCDGCYYDPPAKK